jgi:hypothetical protein
MARGYVIFGDIEGKLCKRCGRTGRYNVHKLIEKHGRKGNLTVWLSDLRADCPESPGFWIVATSSRRMFCGVRS